MIWLSAFALKYTQGDYIGGLVSTCRNIAAWRRMVGVTNSPTDSEMAIFWMDGAIRLYADMLANLPANATVPEDCALALQPVSVADVDSCAQSGRQFLREESNFNWLEKLYSKTGGFKYLFISATYDLKQTVIWEAEMLAVSCSDSAIKRLLSDERPLRQSVHYFFGIPTIKGLACISNINGCALIAKEMLAHENSDAITLDFAAHLRLAATLLWLREHPEGLIADHYTHRPAELHSLNHNSGFDINRGMIYVENFYQAHDRDKQFELPIVAVH
jgi:hypothetical protein